MIPTLEQPFYVSPKTSERLPVTDVRIHQGLGAHAHFIGSVDCPVLQPGHFTSVHACFMWFEVFARPGRISFRFRLFERPAVVTATVFVCSTLSLSQLEWPFHPLVSVWEQLTRSRLQRARSCKSTCATFGIHIFTACCCIECRRIAHTQASKHFTVQTFTRGMSLVCMPRGSTGGCGSQLLSVSTHLFDGLLASPSFDG